MVTIGLIEGSNPKKHVKDRVNGGIDQLNTRDIVGAAPGTKRLGNFHSVDRKHFIETNNTKDIGGAQSSTIKRGLQSTRQTNPLNPSYTLPGASEVGQNNENNPYNDNGSSMGAKYMQLKKQQEAKQEAARQKTLKETVAEKAAFKKDMAKFYAVNPSLTKQVDLDKFVGQVGQETQRPQTVPSATTKQLNDWEPKKVVQFETQQRPQTTINPNRGGEAF